MKANLGYGKLIYPVKELEDFIHPIERANIKRLNKEGWLISHSYTSEPNVKYINGSDRIKKKLDHYLQTEKDDEADILSTDLIADDLARKVGFIVDEFGVVQGFKDRNLVYEANPDYIPYLIRKIKEEPTLYQELEYVPEEVKKEFPELERSGSLLWFKNNEKYMKTFEDFINEKNNSGQWVVGWGLGGGFGGMCDYELLENEDEDSANVYAWEKACEEYESYAGMHGLRDIGQIMEEDGIDDEEEAIEIFNEEREDWLDYMAEPYDPEKHDDLL